jgi:hypothetical protein
MKESYTEGVANHGDPESCAVLRKGFGEVLTGARVGWVLSREIRKFRVPTLLSEGEGNMAEIAIASSRSTLRGRRPHACAESPCARTGRSLDRLPWMVRQTASGRQ